MTSSKPFVLVAGATGVTGHRMVEGLLSINAFKLGVLSRSASNPHIQKFAAQGIETRIIDVNTASHEDLVRILESVDVLVSFVGLGGFESQKPLFKAAKDAGVGRVVPSDFGPACGPGVMHVQDEKLDVRDYVRALGIPYTFIEVGWWTALGMFPRPGEASDMWASSSWRVYGDGNTKVAVTALERIPDFLALIIQDERTIGKTVFCWEDEITQNRGWELAKQMRPDIDWASCRTNVSNEQALAQVAASKAAYEAEPGFRNFVPFAMAQYVESVFIRGDNTLENAKRLGAIDARELYPSFKPNVTEEYAREFYENVPPHPYAH